MGDDFCLRIVSSDDDDNDDQCGQCCGVTSMVMKFTRIIISIIAGKKRCGANAHQTLQVLSDLLGHDNQEVSVCVFEREYVSGWLSV